MRAPNWLNWRLTLLFAVLGPFVGAMPLLISVAVSGEASANLDLVPLFLAWAYFFGTAPAVLTGLLLPAVVGLLPKPHRDKIWLQLLVASATGFVISWLLFAALTPFSAGKLAMLGALSALVCMLSGLLLRVGPNNSFKPKPLRGSA
ncbi:uncharacterized BrkB/YihY/UPF0761 family membrane protein [Lysobacter niastensis]|uniref:Inner membrane protein CbrB n=1 Tax=Lysobacter niastensis TaxID=380629 RepID=A0ABU1W8W7_9GAMM|nr:hypothetical protein [Lysobacter niastensis]MDR7134054.1 uncharacterized BrkB/YihY/UPF0761 family membrane protein [Lysobacter niastensis]